MRPGDEEYRLRPRPGRSRRDTRPESFLKTVRKLSAQAPGAGGVGGRARARYNSTGRGRAMIGGRALSGRWAHLDPGARRVVVKARVIKRAASAAAAAHLTYLQRDGVRPDGSRGQLYSAGQDRADGADFRARSAGDPHQFRLIVAPEDGGELADLKAFTRGLMAEVERDLGAPLDWVAVDHFNTAHPHTHVVLRGADRTGQPLFIAGAYMAHGFRERASELMTLELGPETWAEVRRKLESEVNQPRFTRIDRAMLRTAEQGVVDLAVAGLKPFDHQLWRGRLAVLERMGLADREGDHAWRLNPDLEPTLRGLGERDDIVKTINRALADRGMERAAESFSLHDRAPEIPVVGRLIGKALTDELGDRLTLVVDGIDGRVHHVPGGQLADADDPQVGAIIEVASSAAARPSDRAVAERSRSNGGIYRPSEHLAEIRRDGRLTDAEAIGHVEAHVRRLEALRRSGLVERLDEDRWRIPAEHEARAAAYEARRRTGVVRTLSLLDLDAQVTATGATWLDRQLVSRSPAPRSPSGFGGEVEQALSARRARHLALGDADPAGPGRARYRAGLLAELERRELQRTGEALATERGRPFRAAQDGEKVKGVFKDTVALASGRYALVERAHDFTLVPWRPVIEPLRGQAVTGVMQGLSIAWRLGRDRGLGV